MPTKDSRLEERFWSKVEKTNTCWIWKAYKDKDGYGRIRRKVNEKQTNVFAHRVSYEIHNGCIPDGMQVCHSCDNPRCVNPDHLWIGSNKDNNNDKMNKGRHNHGTQYGEQSSNAKLTEIDVRNIRSMRSSGMLLKDIGKLFGVHYVTIGQVVSGKTWNHVK